MRHAVPAPLSMARIPQGKMHIYYRRGAWWAYAPAVGFGHEAHAAGPYSTPLLAWGEDRPRKPE